VGQDTPIYCRPTLNWLWKAVGTTKFENKISWNIFEFSFEFNFCEISYQVAELWQLTKAEQLWQILEGFENCPL
jgi:hypothetical protein